MSFLSDYREFTSGNEAHPTYHLFSSLIALSSIVSRRVWLDMDYFTIYPNLYVVLVGPPGNRKSSAMATTKYLLRELQKIPFSGECISKEKLVEDMFAQERAIEGLPDKYKDKRIYSPMTICVTELSEFLAISQAGMIGFLTDVYDQDFYEHKTKNKGTSIITGPFLNLIACTTPEWITTYLRSDIISGGFSRRTLFVFETEKSNRIPFPTVTPAMREAWARLFTHAHKLLEVRGAFQWDPEAKAFYSQWYINLEIPKDENVIGYYETKHIQMLKIAMLVALSESTTSLILTKRHIEIALDFLKLVETNLARVFQSMGRNLLNITATKVLDLLRRSGTTKFTDPLGQPREAHMLSLKKVQSAMFSEVDQNDLAKVIDHLKQTDKITVETFRPEGSKVDREYVMLKV
jgi:hypothetical protein